MKKLADSDGRRWSFMRVKWIGGRKNPLMWRLNILQTPLFSIMLHRIFRPDADRDLHDHPWTFFSIVLRGWYEEIIGDTVRQCVREIRRFNFKRAEDRHQIRFVSRRPVWTLVFAGRRRREWGFWVYDCVPDCRESHFCPERWVHNEEYERNNPVAGMKA